MLTWRFAPFDQLTPREVHDLYRLRIEVFVLEQECPFQDVDGADPGCWHLLGVEGAGGAELVAYSRLVPPGLKFEEPSIGRVVAAMAVRRTGAGKALMAESIGRARSLWPGLPIRIGAQARLEKFYNGFGFAKASDMYMEDGIAHIEMVLPAGGAAR